LGLGPLGLVWRPSGLFIPWKISTLTFPPACVWPPHHDLATTPLPAGIPSEARGSSERAHPEQKEAARTARAASREQQGASSGCSPAASRGWLGGCDFAIAGGMQEGRECGNVERVERVEWKQDGARVQMQRGPRSQSVSRLLSPFSVFRSAFLWVLLLGSRPSFFGSRIPPRPASQAAGSCFFPGACSGAVPCLVLCLVPR
jgi:hypothetical protein